MKYQITKTPDNKYKVEVNYRGQIEHCTADSRKEAWAWVKLLGLVVHSRRTSPC